MKTIKAILKGLMAIGCVLGGWVWLALFALPRLQSWKLALLETKVMLYIPLVLGVILSQRFVTARTRRFIMIVLSIIGLVSFVGVAVLLGTRVDGVQTQRVEFWFILCVANFVITVGTILFADWLSFMGDHFGAKKINPVLPPRPELN